MYQKSINLFLTLFLLYSCNEKSESVIKSKPFQISGIYPHLAMCNNSSPHSWFIEMSCIHSIEEGKMIMDIYGIFYFSEFFSATNTDGIKLIDSHLRYIPDFLIRNG